MSADSNFLKCVYSYPDAANALAQFRDIVQQRCLTVFDKHLEALCRAIGYDGELQELAKFAYPDRSKPNETSFFALGAKAVHAGKLEVCSRLYWLRDGNGASTEETGLSVYLWFDDTRVKAVVLAELKAADQDWHFRNQGWYLSDSTLPELNLALNKREISDFELHLDKLLKWTIGAINSRPKIRKVVRAWAKVH